MGSTAISTSTSESAASASASSKGTALPAWHTSIPANVMSKARGSTCAPDLPMAIATRPQFASCPKTAVLTSGEFAIEKAASSASVSEAAPATCTVMSFVAPSPSRAIMRASALATAWTAPATDA